MAAVPAAHDVNMEAAGALLDLAIAHPGRHARIAYRRAARAVLALDQPLDEVARTGDLRSIRSIGPSSERVLREALEDGRSATAERLIEAQEAGAEIAAARRLRRNFLSHAEVLRVLAAGTRGVIERGDYRGDLQMHSRWSDGAEPIAALARAAERLGQQYIAVTDHSYGLRIARGVSMADIARQHREIKALNRRVAPFRVLKGIEANIRPDGTVDMEPGELARFEIVLAAPHSALRKADDQTGRMLTAVRTPGVHVLAHPRGRMVTRQGVLADWDAVFAEAKRRDVAIELDGDPWRQDLDFTLARQALRAGCLFALDSDAHSGDELDYSDYALAHARLAGIPAVRVINTWPVERLLEWAARS